MENRRKARIRIPVLFAVPCALACTFGIVLNQSNVQRERNVQLMHAVVHGDQGEALYWLREGADPNSRWGEQQVSVIEVIRDWLLRRPKRARGGTPVLLLAAESK